MVRKSRSLSEFIQPLPVVIKLSMAIGEQKRPRILVSKLKPTSGSWTMIGSLLHAASRIQPVKI